MKQIAWLALSLFVLNTCFAEDGTPINTDAIKGEVFIGKVVDKYDPSKILLINVGRKNPAVLVCADALTPGFDTALDIIKQSDPHPAENLQAKYSNYKIGDKVLVQCFQNPTTGNAARVTTNLSLASEGMLLCYPLTGIAVSKSSIGQIREWAMDVRIPQGCGLIVRKGASQATIDELNQQLSGLVHRMESILRSATTEDPPKLLDE